MVFPPVRSKTPANEGKAIEPSIEKLLKDALVTFKEDSDPTSEEAKVSDLDPVQSFAIRYKKRLEKSGSGQEFTKDEVLNHLAREGLEDKYKPFVKWAVRQYGGLLTCVSDGGYTPLLLAIREENDDFIDCVLQCAKNVPDLLAQKNSQKASCLHLAIEKQSQFTEEFIARIVESPRLQGKEDNIFTMKYTNNKYYYGTTPLHMAVLAAFSSSPKAAAHIAGTGTPRDMQANPIEKQQLQRVGGTGVVAAEMNMAMRRTGSNMAPPSKSAHAPVSVKSHGDSSRTFQKTFSALDVVKKLVNANPGVLVHERDANGHTPFQALFSRIQDSQKDALARLKTIKQREERRRAMIDNNDVLSFLRRYIICNFSRRDAMEALYKVQDRRELDFDLSGFPFPVINRPFLEGLATVLRFEVILKCVALPRLTMAYEKEDRAVIKAGGEIYTGRGVDHMCGIFQWLRDQNVRTILKLSVDDNVEPSHSDEMIEQCLKGFDVRIWNWYKLDLCCDVIANVAKNVEDVTLYSSGNNAVLVGWSSEAGLLKLKQLKRVTVYVQDGLESRERLNGYMDKFEATLKGKGIACKCILRQPQTANNVEDPVEKEAGQYQSDSGWIGAVQRFGRFLLEAKPDQPVQPIKIAIIDDGIDLSLDIFRDKIQKGHSFFQLSELTGHYGSFFVPMGKHGTLMAYLICNICPVVELYIAQLEVLKDGQGQRSFTAQSAEDAIRWATDQGVDIISMSWSVSSPGPIKGMDDALKKAHESGIVMFCSSVDEDPSMDVNTYPGRAKSCCLVIGAATALGGRLSWVAEGKSDFLLPCEVPPMSMDKSVLWAQNSVSDPYRDAFGSSVSTALAAGLAGVLLYCDRLLESDNPLPNSGLRRQFQGQMKKDMPDRVRRMFKYLSYGMDVNKFPRVAAHLPRGPLIWNRKMDPNGTEKTKKELRKFMDRLAWQGSESSDKKNGSEDTALKKR